MRFVIVICGCLLVHTGNNCMRGGFVCEGYTCRVEWQKNSREKVPVPLQAKDGEAQAPGSYVPPSLPPPPPQEDKVEAMHDALYERNLPHRRSYADGRNGADSLPRLMGPDDERDRQLAPISPRHQGRSLDPLPNNIWNASNGPTYLNDPLPRPDFGPRKPLPHELPRVSERERKRSPPDVGPRTMMHKAASGVAPPTPQQQAQQALQHHSSLRASEKSEKMKMLGQEGYLPSDPDLVAERDRCKRALWGFNTSMNPTLGISDDERYRLLRNVLVPRASPNGPPLPGPIGRLGDHVEVESPFHCTYGYNLTIGNEVSIGFNCHIMDTCSVTIGARTVIGPNCNILAATMPIDPRKRRGSVGHALGRPIVIGEDCWIGTGCTIL